MMDTSTKLLIHIYRIYRSILLVLPLNFIIKVARIKAYLIAYVFPKDRNIALTQLRYVFKNKLPDKRLQQLSFLTFANVGQIAVESIVIKKLLTKENNEFKYVSSTNRKFVEEIFQAKKSCLALSGHIGCFELLAAFYAADGIDVSVIGRAPNYKLLDIFAKRLRHSYGIESIWREDPASFRKLINAFKTGRVVAALIDQDTAVESTFAPFLDYPRYPQVA